MENVIVNQKNINVLLIQPYVTSEDPNIFLIEPLGLSTLANYIKDSYNVKIIDLFALGCDNLEKKGSFYTRGLSDPAKIIELVRQFDPDVVGISSKFTSLSTDADEVAKLIKTVFEKVLIFFGGPHATFDADNILKTCPYIDFIVRSEGELTFKEALDKIASGDSFNEVKGITYRTKEGTIIKNPDREFIPDLSILPLNDRSNLDMSYYLKSNLKILSFVKQEPVVTLMTSRGCPYNCIFCSTKNMWRLKWRPIPAKQVVDEIELLVNKYGVKEIAINDDQFMFDKQRVIDICDLLIEKKLGITVSNPAGTSIWLVDEELLKKMKKAGFYRLNFPIETGDPNTVKFIKKPINLDRAKKIIDIALRLGFWTQGNFIIGFPHETKEEIETTIKYAFDSGLDYAHFFIAQPYKGAELYDVFLKEGLLNKVQRGSDMERTMYDTKTMKAEEIQRIRDEANRAFVFHKIRFYSNPLNFYNYFLPKNKNFRDIKYTFKLVHKMLIRPKTFLIRKASVTPSTRGWWGSFLNKKFSAKHDENS